MADVPAWVVVLNTAAAGGFGLLGTYLVPRGQREARAHEERRANAAIMRDKAEQIFDEISKLEQTMGAQFVATTRAMASGKDDDDLPLPNFDRIRSLAAVYYPGLLTILAGIEASLQERMQRVQEALVTAATAKPLAAQVADLRLVTFQVTIEQWRAVTFNSEKLRSKLIEEVSVYLPAGMAQGAPRPGGIRRLFGRIGVDAR